MSCFVGVVRLPAVKVWPLRIKDARHCVVTVHIDDDLDPTWHGLPVYASAATSIGIGITRRQSRLRCR